MSKEKTVKQACFLCTTSFQIWGAVAFQLANRWKADILVFDDLNGYREIAEGLRQTGLFEEVIPVPFYGSLKGKNRRSAIAARMLTAGSYTDKLVDSRTAYERLYTSSAAVSKTVVIRGLSKRLDRAGIVVYDDGLGSYSEKGRIRTGSARFRKLKKMLGWEEPLEHPEKIMLYEPELYHATEGIPVERMPKIVLTSESKALLRTIFGESEEELLVEQQVMLFDTFRLPDPKEEIVTLDRVFEQIAEICGNDNVILKEHPRSLAHSTVGVPRFSRAEVPMELIYAHQEDLSDRILVGLNSTALFTPRMLFDAEPYLILLYRMTSQDPAVREKRDAYLGKMTGMYRDGSRVAIPETPEELEQVLTRWLRKTDETAAGSGEGPA
nr:hypothetical protein [Lachnospiraceae bacterium]